VGEKRQQYHFTQPQSLSEGETDMMLVGSIVQAHWPLMSSINKYAYKKSMSDKTPQLLRTHWGQHSRTRELAFHCQKTRLRIQRPTYPTGLRNRFIRGDLACFLLRSTAVS
jgi:hypothetical protein